MTASVHLGGASLTVASIRRRLAVVRGGVPVAIAEATSVQNRRCLQPGSLRCLLDLFRVHVTQAAHLRHRCDVTAMSIEDAYKKWGDDLVRYATALAGPADAPDLVAEAFTTVLARGDGAWVTVDEPRAYLYRVVTNSARMSARSGLRRRARELRWRTEGVTGELLVDPRVQQALDHLSVRLRAVVYLTYWHDLAPSAVASLLSISDGAVKRHLARARSTLREVLA